MDGASRTPRAARTSECTTGALRAKASCTIVDETTRSSSLPRLRWATRRIPPLASGTRMQQRSARKMSRRQSIMRSSTPRLAVGSDSVAVAFRSFNRSAAGPAGAPDRNSFRCIVSFGQQGLEPVGGRRLVTGEDPALDLLTTLGDPAERPLDVRLVLALARRVVLARGDPARMEEVTGRDVRDRAAA